MVPFTSAQWKELERQAMIYKYMISSVPVPPHLLHSSLSSAAGVEIGRCKRTDGKKWRCSRDVAPHQKYCERHLHRGRPRSRKPVEQQQQQQQVYTNIKNDNNGDDDENHKKPRLQQFAADDEQSLVLFNSETGFNTNVSTHHGNRELDSTMDNEMFACHEASQKWHNLLETNMGFTNEESSIYGSNEIFHQDYNVDQQPLDHVSSYSYFRSSDIDAPTGFIDLNTTNDNLNTDYSLSTNYENFCPWLNLSISGYGETGNVHMRDGVDSYNDDSNCLETFGLGGPLAEVLGGNSTSPHGSTSGPATAVSSPSGVLQRTLFSYSEGSVCNSPLEIGLQWIMK